MGCIERMGAIDNLLEHLDEFLILSFVSSPHYEYTQCESTKKSIALVIFLSTYFAVFEDKMNASK